MADRTEQNREEITALVLSGGGAKGAFQAGVLQVLREQGNSFDVISGTSVGTLNGAMLATGQFDELIDIWRDLSEEKVMKKHSLITLARRYLFYKLGLGEPPVSRYSNRPLQKLLRKHLLGRRTSLPFYFGYVKLESGTYVSATIRRSGAHTIDEGDLDRLLASTAIPVYFNPTYIGNRTAVDGGLRNISPIGAVLPHRPDRVIIIPTEPVGDNRGDSEVRDILEIAFRSIRIMLDEIFHEDISRFLTVNRLVRQAEGADLTLTKEDGTSYKYFEPLVIDPKTPLGDPLDFDNAHLHKMMKAGRNRARELLGVR